MLVVCHEKKADCLIESSEIFAIGNAKCRKDFFDIIMNTYGKVIVEGVKEVRDNYDFF